jgi:Dyp-type peroxidase family
MAHSPSKKVDLNKPISHLKLHAYQALMKDLQGNILKSHGRDHVVHIFICFKQPVLEDPAAAKSWIRKFAATYVTSAQQQYDESIRYRRAKNAGEPFAGKLFASLLLSADGYDALGCGGAHRPQDWSFRQGQKRADRLYDPPLQEWEYGFQARVDAMILLADDYVDRLDRAVEQIKAQVRRVAQIVHIDRGQVLRNANEQVIEHFGYVDGVSQPLFFPEDIRKAEQQNRGESQWDPGAPLSLVLVIDPHGRGPHSFGSYGVYRKLQQDVHCFRQRVRDYARMRGISEELAGSHFIGRSKDGTPLAAHNSQPSRDNIPNNFNYADDPDGEQCPFSAHMRKMNPRSDVTRMQSPLPLEWAREHRIARRSITYGVPYDEDTKPEDKQRGLLFLCFQSDITEQFEYIQSAWANQQNFVRRDEGLDPLIGQDAQLAGRPCITMLGGEYFFAPSISGLQKLSATVEERGV